MRSVCRYTPGDSSHPLPLRRRLSRTAPHGSAYEAARRRVAHIIFQARTHVWTQSQFPAEPLFRFNEADVSEPMVSTPEFEDITKCITDDNVDQCGR